MGPKGETMGAANAERRARLLALLRKFSMISGKEMKLASGRTSDIYFDMKMAMFHPEALTLIAGGVLAVLREEGAASIGGLELGAVPIVSAVVCQSHPDHPVTGFLVRKTVKEHGTQKKIEGHFDPTVPVVILDDVVTTGGSTLEAVNAVRAAGGSVTTCLTIVDREEGATENLARQGLALRSLFSKADFRT